MTSPSRRNRRITAWSTAIAISLSGAALFAQSPGSPAPTNWQPHTPYVPPVPKSAPTVPAPVSNVELPPLPPPVTGQNPPPKLDAKPLPVVKPRDGALPPPPRSFTLTPPVVWDPAPAAAAPTPAPAQATIITSPRAPAPAPVNATIIPAPRTPTQAAAPAPSMKTLPPALTEMPVIPVAAPPPVSARPALLIRPQTQPPTPPPAPGPAPPTPSAEQAKLDALPQVVMPSKTELFRFETDAVIDARVFKELNKPVEPLPLTPQLVPPGTKYEPKTVKYEPSEVLREPNYVIHRRLYFEEMNSERAGWDSGPSQALFSSLYFYKDVALLPCKFFSGCKSCFDASSGKCMPGNPTPYYFYPLASDITPAGGLGGVVAIVGLCAIFP